MIFYIYILYDAVLARPNSKYRIFSPPTLSMMEFAKVFSPRYEKTAIFTEFHGVIMEIAMVFSPWHDSCHFHGISRPNLFPRPCLVSTAIW